MADKVLDINGLEYYNEAIQEEISGKQDTLVSGTNIKTINNTSILGSGNISVGGGDGLSAHIIGNFTNTSSDRIDFQLDEASAGIYIPLFMPMIVTLKIGNSTVATKELLGNIVIKKSYADAQTDEIFMTVVNNMTSCQLEYYKKTSNGISQVSITSVPYYGETVIPTKKTNDLITGTYTFDTPPKIGTLPTNQWHATPKKYVDDSIATAIGTALTNSY